MALSTTMALSSSSRSQSNQSRLPKPPSTLPNTRGIPTNTQARALRREQQSADRSTTKSTLRDIAKAPISVSTSALTGLHHSKNNYSQRVNLHANAKGRQHASAIASAVSLDTINVRQPSRSSSKSKKPVQTSSSSLNNIVSELVNHWEQQSLMHQQRQQRVTPAAKDRPTTDWIPYTENKLEKKLIETSIEMIAESQANLGSVPSLLGSGESLAASKLDLTFEDNDYFNDFNWISGWNAAQEEAEYNDNTSILTLLPEKSERQPETAYISKCSKETKREFMNSIGNLLNHQPPEVIFTNSDLRKVVLHRIGDEHRSSIAESCSSPISSPPSSTASSRSKLPSPKKGGSRTVKLYPDGFGITQPHPPSVARPQSMNPSPRLAHVRPCPSATRQKATVNSSYEGFNSTSPAPSYLGRTRGELKTKSKSVPDIEPIVKSAYLSGDHADVNVQASPLPAEKFMSMSNQRQKEAELKYMVDLAFDLDQVVNGTPLDDSPVKKMDDDRSNPSESYLPRRKSNRGPFDSIRGWSDLLLEGSGDRIEDLKIALYEGADF